MKKFDRSFNGYNVEQVNSFVDDVISRVEDMIDNMICDNINKNGIQKSDERLDKCIELLQELRNNK